MSEKVATEGIVNGANAAQNQVNGNTKKRHGRGITNETRTVAQLKFDEKLANPTNFLFQTVIDTVEVKYAQIGEDVKGLPSFTGLTIPVFVVRFHSLHSTPNEYRWVSLRLMTPESNAEVIPGAKNAWRVENVFSYIKHLLEVLYLKGRPFTEEEMDALELPFEDYEEENGHYVYKPIDAEEVIKGWDFVFQNAAAMLNGTWNLKEGVTPKPCYVDPSGKRIRLWTKLLRFTKVNNQWQPVVRGKSNMGDLGFPNFLGEGVIEVVQKDKAPLMKVNTIRESITPKEIAKAPMQPNMPMMGGVPPMGGVPTMGGMMPSAGGSEAATGSGVDYSQFEAQPADDFPF